MSEENKTNNQKDKIILSLIIIFFISINFIFLQLDKTPEVYDGENYFEMSVLYHEALFNTPLKFIDVVLTKSADRPPFVMLTTIPFYTLFGISQDVAVLTNMLYLIIMVLSVYGIGKITYNRQTGLIAAAITPAIPLLTGFSRLYFVDFALGAIITLNVYLLLKTKDFTDKKFIIYSALSIGAGCLTKFTYPLIIAPIIIYFIIRGIRRSIREKNTKKLIKKFILFGIIILAIGGSFYIVKLDMINFFVNDTEIVGDKIISWEHNLFYFSELKSTILFPVIFYLGIFAFIFLFYKKNRENKIFFPIWILTPMIILPFIVLNMPRYISGMIPGIAILIANMLYLIGKKISKKITAIIILIIIGQSLFLTFFPYPNIIPNIYKELVPPYAEDPAYGHIQLQTKDWKTDEIIKTFSEVQKRKGRDIIITYASQYGMVYSPVQQKMFLEKLPFIIYMPGETLAGGIKSCGYEECSEKTITNYVDKADIIVKATNIPYEENWLSDKVKEIFKTKQNEFKEIKEIELPSGFKFKIYERIKIVETE